MICVVISRENAIFASLFNKFYSFSGHGYSFVRFPKPAQLLKATRQRARGRHYTRTQYVCFISSSLVSITCPLQP